MEEVNEDILASSVELLRVEVSFIEATLVHAELFTEEVSKHAGSWISVISDCLRASKR